MELAKVLALDTVKSYQMAEIAEQVNSLKSRIGQSQKALQQIWKFSLCEGGSTIYSRSALMGATWRAYEVGVQAQLETSFLQRSLKSYKSSNERLAQQLEGLGVKTLAARASEAKDAKGQGFEASPSTPVSRSYVQEVCLS